jgi:single-stranded-DNA-specific exonuclease
VEKTIVRRPNPAISPDLHLLHPVLQRVYSARHIVSTDDLSKELSSLLPFSSLIDIGKAVARLQIALEQQQQILIIGDFDADGATSTALAVSVLRALGAKQVQFLIPNRFAYGYGLTPEIVMVAKQYNPDLIITVDNGISSHAGIAQANALNIDVIVTDHHLAAETLPAAYAIVNPNQPTDPFPSKCLAGVGVIFYLMLALRAQLKKINWFEQQAIVCPNMAQFLDLVALGTVADVVPLDKNNRILVHQGLRQIREGKARPGIMALLEIAGRKCEKLRALDLGFIVAPRLNAAGRLDDMSLGVACLLAEDLVSGLEMARRLDDLNKERRVIESQMQQEAFAALDQLNLTQQLPHGLCLYHQEWHQGVIGLVAARVKEKVNRPVIAFAKVDEQTLKGSARSVSGLHIRDVLHAIATQHPQLITKFGGHAMAAGLSLPIECLAEFQQVFAEQVKTCLAEEDLRPTVISDGELTPDEFTLTLAELLTQAGPFGQGFPEPVFDGQFKLINQRIVGQSHLKLTLQLPASDHYIDAIAFNVDTSRWPNYHCQQVQLAYRLDVNEYQGRRKLQLLIEEIQPQ